VRALVAWCVRRRGAVAVLALVLLLLGTWDAGRVPLDVFPEFVPVQVEIQTEAPGLAPEQVEQLVTRPIEAAVNGAPDLAAMRSESIPGLSVVSLNFTDNADVHRARQGIAERVAALGSALPAGVGTPTLSPLVSSTMDLLKIGLVSVRLDPYALRDRAEWVLKPQLLAVPGVARITVFGGAVRQIQIQPQMDKLAAYGLTLSELADAGRAALALRGAGFLDLKAQRVLIESPTPAPDPRMVAEAVIAVRQGVPVRLRDVARVSEAPALQTGDALIQGRPGVLLSMSSQFGANTLTVTRAVEQTLATLVPELKADGIEVYPALHRPANFIEVALHDIRQSLLLAGVLILIVLFAFLRNWRSAGISFLAIPLSLVAAAVVLGRLGLTLNTMTLGGFAVALGVLVDDAIIGIENTLRRLRQNAASATPGSRLEVIRDATVEIRGPVLYATLVVLMVFVPVLVTSGVQGRFVGPLAIAFMLSVLASLGVALTVTPALSALLLSAREVHLEPRWIGPLKRLQARCIGFADRHFRAVVAGLVVLFVAALAVLPLLSAQFMPDFREGHFVVQVDSAVPGTSLEEMRRLGLRISHELLALPFVATVEQQLGRSEGGEDTWGTQRSEFHAELKADAGIDQAAAQDRIRKVLGGYPGLNVEVVTFLGDRLSESLTGETRQEVVNIFGDDLATLDTVAAEAGDVLGKVPGVVDLQVSHVAQTPAMRVTLRPERVAAHGLRAQEVLETVQTAYAGVTVGQAYAGVRKVDAVVIAPEGVRQRTEQLGALLIGSPFGPVPLRELADVSPSEGRFSILHEDGQRRVAVTFNVKGANLQSVVKEAKRRLAAAMPPHGGIHWQFTGQAEAGHAGVVQLVLYAALALALVVMLLFLCFHRRAHPWLVLINLPFSLIGSVLVIALTGVGLSVGTLVGLATVFGVGARNSILLLAHYEHLIETEGATWNEETVLRGASERLVPILMTATVTALGLAPLAIGMSRPGQEIEGPMAVSVLGGLMSSTLLNLLVLPAFAGRYSYRPEGPRLVPG
jgi:CzcA family heavy metal efflux pump